MDIMSEVSQAQEVHKKLREILIRYQNPEFGDCIVDEICFLFDHETTTDVEKVNMKQGDFLGWYFSDSSDVKILANNLIGDLLSTGAASTTVQDLIDGCGYIPGFITDGDEDAEYDPSDVNLI